MLQEAAQGPAQARWHHAVESAEAAGVLDGAWCWSLPAVVDARSRLVYRGLRERGRGKPLTVEQLKADAACRRIILKALPQYAQWTHLHDHLVEAHSETIPHSWAGFVRLLERLGFQARGDGYGPEDYDRLRLPPLTARDFSPRI